MSQFVNPRKPESDVHPQFVDRWSPRSFDETVLVTRNQIDSVLEAARWAPSCFNEQPWRIFVAAKPSAMFDKFLGALVEKNQCWAKSASALMFIACSLTFKRNNKPNNWAEFDTGSAWISMALQAQVLGLHMHAMAGFDTEKAHQVLEKPTSEMKIIAAAALGKKAVLPHEDYADEAPNDRMAKEEFAKIFVQP